MHRRTLLALAIGIATLPVAAATIAGQQFEERIRLADRDLVLNGLGVRAVAWLQGYAAALYLEQKAHSAAAVTALPGPKRLRMKMLVEVEAKEFAKAFGKGMRRNLPPAVHAAMADRIAAFDRHVLSIGMLRKGDVVDLDFLPPAGTVLLVNGKARGAPVAGDDFNAGLLRIFVGDDPVDDKLKAGLLGATS
jgi:hypothetical protein